MNETYEKEINLKWLCYRVIRGWKCIVILTLVGALLLGLAGFGLSAVKLLDDKYMAEARLVFDRKHAAWLAIKENYLFSIEKLEESKDRQVEYNEKSIMMDIDPMKKTVASFELYVKYDYKIYPDQIYQDPDLSDRILRSYATYMTNGEMYHYIMQNLDYDIELRYLTEILGVSVDYDNNFISINVVHTNEETCQEILSLAKIGIESRTAQIAKDIDEHSIILSNQVAYEVIDQNLKDYQNANIQAVTNLDTAINELNQEFINWQAGIVKLEEGQKEEDVVTGIEPVFEYDLMEVTKDAVKKAIIGAAVGLVLAIVYLAVTAIMSGKLLNPEDMKSRYGLRVIGLLPAKNSKRISARIARIGGVKIKKSEYDAQAKMIGSSVRSDVLSRSALDCKTIAFTGTAPAEEMEQAVAAMGVSGYKIVCAPDVLTNAASIEKVTSAECVILVEKQEVSIMDEVDKELEALKAWNKTVLGAVVLGADAI